RMDQTVLWPARINQAAEFEVWAKYSTGSAASRGKFAVEIADQKLEAAVEPTPKDTEPREVKLGGAKLAPEIAAVRVTPGRVGGGELIRLFSVALQPAKPAN